VPSTRPLASDLLTARAEDGAMHGLPPFQLLRSRRRARCLLTALRNRYGALSSADTICRAFGDLLASDPP